MSGERNRDTIVALHKSNLSKEVSSSSSNCEPDRLLRKHSDSSSFEDLDNDLKKAERELGLSEMSFEKPCSKEEAPKDDEQQSSDEDTFEFSLSIDDQYFGGKSEIV